MFQQVGEPNHQLPITQSDGRIQAGKSPELDLQRRYRSSRSKGTILLLEDREYGIGNSWQS